ncbi:hypothetical protein [Streptomyces sp. NRRL S-118]|uniref:hypothetical protein n=1 Tax=Streptomyces sp. NRRL S-118 TaxID=1463881 RepID=UPI000693BA9A|nr:hypothetical protein [Streptomyces sp. NRRL S-118]
MKRAIGAVRAATVTAVLALATAAASGTATAAAAKPVPDFSGKGLMSVFSTMDYRTRIDVHDASGYGRTVLWPSSWKVCSQHPAPGTEIGDRTLTVEVMKTTEKCPSGTAR